MQVIIYNEKELKIDKLNIQSFECDLIIDGWRSLTGEFGASDTGQREIKFVGRESEKIELDPTTMKKIAKFNKDKEFNKINEDIEYYQKQLDYAKEEYDNFKKKLNEVRTKSKNYLFGDLEEFLEEELDDEYDEYYED